MRILKSILIIVVVLTVSYFLSTTFGDFYKKLFHEVGTWTDLRGFFGLPLAYTFFLTLFFTAFGGHKKYWWIGVLLVPAAIFELYFDAAHIYFPIGLALLGWLLGFAFHRLVRK